MVYNILRKSRSFNFLMIHFNNMSLRRKIVLSYFLFIFLLIGTLSMTIYTVISRTILEQNTFSFSQSFQQANSYLTYKLQSVSSSSDMLIYNVTLNSILSRDMDDYSHMQQIADSKAILELLKNMQENDDIKLARIYVPDELSYSGNGINIRPFSQAAATVWWEPLLQKKGLHLFVGDDSLEDESFGNKKRISLIRAMYSQYDYSQLSFILRLDVPYDTIEDILDLADYTNDSLTLIYNDQGTVVAQSSGLKSDYPFISKNNKLLVPEIPMGEVTPLSFDSSRYMALQSDISGIGWKMMTLVPYTSFASGITTLTKIIVGVSLLILLIAYFLSKPIAYSITKRLDKLCGFMQRATGGELVEVPDIIYKDEIGILYENYNFMISRIRSLISKNYQMGIELKSAEYKALQSQINPHFLYNTLDMISWLSYQNKSEEITSVVYALANFYKLSLNKGKDIVTLSDEINHLTYFMKIQEFRFSGKIKLNIDVPPELLQYSIPKITLQPIVENALFHGILEKKSKSGSITVTGKRENELICLQITDDGIGIPSEQLKGLLEDKNHLETPDETGSHYGLHNINRRIRLQYGEAYGLSFESISGKGTTVSLLLPAMHVDEL